MKNIKRLNTSNLSSSDDTFNIPILNHPITSDHKVKNSGKTLIVKYFKYQLKDEYKDQYLGYKNIKDNSSVKYFKYKNI